MTKRVLIIGAGPGGLAAAMLLTKAGLEVTVLERLAPVQRRLQVINGVRHEIAAGARQLAAAVERPG